MGFEALVGNGALKDQLSARLQGRGLSHAYLISGAPGSGKRTLAGLLSAAMVCTGPGERPCGVCPGCKKALSGIHPDVTAIGADGKDITVGKAREVRADAYVRPNEAQRKVYIFQNAQSMNAAAQNALLKLLEEGPPYAAFLLLTENPAALLSTIRSRCEGLALSPVSQGEAEEYLSRRFPEADPASVRSAAALCGGILGQAVERLEGREDAAVQEAGRRLAELLAQGDELALAEWCVSLEKWDRPSLERLMAHGLVLFRDALTLQAGGHALLSGEPELVRPLTRQPARRLLGWMKALEDLRSAAAANVGVGHICGALCARLSQ